MDYYMKLLDFLSLLQNRGLSYAISRISFASPKTWPILCNLWNFFPFSKNVDYHLQIMNFLSILPKRGLSYAIYEIISLLHKRGLLYAISRISFPSPKTWTIIYNF